MGTKECFHCRGRGPTVVRCRRGSGKSFCTNPTSEFSCYDDMFAHACIRGPWAHSIYPQGSVLREIRFNQGEVVRADTNLLSLDGQDIPPLEPVPAGPPVYPGSQDGSDFVGGLDGYPLPTVFRDVDGSVEAIQGGMDCSDSSSDEEEEEEEELEMEENGGSPFVPLVFTGDFDPAYLDAGGDAGLGSDETEPAGGGADSPGPGGEALSYANLNNSGPVAQRGRRRGDGAWLVAWGFSGLVPR